MATATVAPPSPAPTRAPAETRRSDTAYLALRYFGLLIAAVALGRLAAVYAPNPFRRRG